jgi:chromosome segregation ATPase
MQAGHKPAELIECATKMLQLELQTGYDLPGLFELYEEEQKELTQIQRTIQDLQKKEKDVRRTMDEALDELNLTSETLNEYQRVRNELADMGVNVNDTKLLAKMLENSKELGFDQNKIIDLISQAESLTTRIAQTEKNLEELTRQEKTLKDHNSKLLAETGELSEKKAEIESSINTIKEQGIKSIGEIRDFAVTNMTTVSNTQAYVLKKYRDEINKASADIVKEREQSLLTIASIKKAYEASIDEVRDKAAKVGQEIGDLEALAPTLNFLNRAEGRPEEVYTLMLLLCRQFETWLHRHYASDILIETCLRSLVDRINEQMRGIG